MHATDTSTGERYLVVVNDEEQYSIWPEDRALPAGWRAEGTSGSKDACLDHIEQVWTDMRPKSLRDALASGALDRPSAEPPLDDEPDDALVRKLSEGTHPVVVTGVGEREGAEAIDRFRERLDRGHVSVMFTDTRGGTELSLRFDSSRVDRASCDFTARSGSLDLAGDLNLDGVDVRCEVQIALDTLTGTGRLVRLG